MEEPSITGIIVGRMQAFLEDPAAPRWAARLAVRDDPPVNVGKLLGKNRPRIDIEVESVAPGPRPKFHFEAKRLNRSQSAAAYVGKDGLGSFVEERYAKGHPAAGMLGYVQTDTVEKWATRVEARLDAARGSCGLPATGAVWKPFKAADHSLPSFSSVHKRKTGPITVFHTFVTCS